MAKRDYSWLFEGSRANPESNCPKCDAIAIANDKIEACFGQRDKIFATHSIEEERIKDIIAFFKENGVLAIEFKKIVLMFLHSEFSDNPKMIKDNYDEALKFLKSQKFI